MTARPKAGRLSVGQKLVVRDARGSWDAIVTKVGRAYVTVVRAESARFREHQFRIDTQQEKGAAFGTAPRFATAEQAEWDGRVAAARAYLVDQGISLDRGSPWLVDDAVITLADAVRGVAR